MDLTINFKNITEAQAITLVKAAKIMEWCGKVGTSRNATFFADGDGNFRPEVSYNSSDPLRFTEKKLALDIEIMNAMKNHTDFKLDFDDTAWQLESDTALNLKPESEREYDELSKIYGILK